ncbi:MAG: allantoicase [Alphaproteobacteria bacterium]|nr:allantoicase [Alphaproteobacteria bacterium]
MSKQDSELPGFARKLINLADARLGAKVLSTSDDFFAAADRMLNPEPPVFKPGVFDDHGQWMDGWESRRKRVEGHDHSVIRLAHAGVIAGFDIDTSYFTGNFPPAASVEAWLGTADPDAGAAWTEILPAVSLKGSSQHFHEIADKRVWSHLRLNMYPDGGIARFRVFGRPHVDWSKRDRTTIVDLLALENGGRVVAWSDEHYGTPWPLLRKGRGVNMGDGWENRRRREPGNEWAIFALGHRGIIRKIEVDTAHFKGNYPDRCSILAADVTGGTDDSLITQSLFWRMLLPEQKLSADHQHIFEKEIAALGPITHLRFNNIPDGGVSRLRMYGSVA